MLYCSGSICVGVTVWFGWGGVVSLCRLKLVENCWKIKLYRHKTLTYKMTHFGMETVNATLFTTNVHIKKILNEQFVL